MSQFFYIHPENPQARLINQAVDIVRKGGVIVYPTDSGYALGCKIEDKGAMERICRIRNLPNGHNFTLMCRDLSELSTYSFVDNVAFRLIKNNTPGNYTFILKGTKEVPRRLLQEKRKTIGMRVPSNPIAQMCKVDERHSTKQEHQQEIGLHALQLLREHVKVCVHQSAHLFFRQCPFDL